MDVNGGTGAGAGLGAGADVDMGAGIGAGADVDMGAGIGAGLGAGCFCNFVLTFTSGFIFFGVAYCPRNNCKETRSLVISISKGN